MNEINNKLYGYDSFDNAYEVDDYPWGFKFRTKRRYWIETTSRGDRECYSTLNPKTDKWCKVKKSTYSAIMVLFLNENDHVRRTGIEFGWSNEVDIYNFIKTIDQSRLNVQQQKALCKAKTIAHVQKKVSYTIEPAQKLTEAEQAAKDKEQKDIKDKLAKYANYQYSQCLIKNNLA